MNAQPSQSNGTDEPVTRFDRKFIEEHRLLERYLANQLPVRGARDLEQWCRAHPQYLEELGIAERAQMSLKLLEASGRSQDLSEPATPWWKTIYVQIGLAAIAVLSLFAFWVLFGKYVLARSALDDALNVSRQGALSAPRAIDNVRLEPDRAPGINRARVSVNHSVPELLDLRIAMTYTNLNLFKVTLEKKDQGRALVIDNIAKDSNGELKISVNTSGLSPGEYDMRIDGLPFRGEPVPLGWLVLNAQ